MYSKFAQRCLSLLMALAMVLSLTPLQTLATETETPASTEAEENVPTEASEPAAEPEANPAVLQLQEAADTVLIRYLGSTTLSYEEIEAIVTSMEWETLQTARYDISVWEESLQAILDCGEATEVELQQLLNGNPDFVDFAEILEANNNVNLLSGETVTPITNVSVVANSDATASNSSGTVTVTVTSKLATRKTGTVKIYNNSDSSATLSFDYSASNLDTEKDTTFKIDDKSKNGATESTASGSYSLLLDAGGYITVSFTAPRGFDDRKATLTLKNFNLVVAAAKSTVTLGTYDTSLGTATINGGTSGEGNTTTAVTLTATPETGVTLLGWVNTETHEWIPTGSYYPTADCTLIPAFASAASTGWFSVSSGMYLYNDLNAAASHASSASNKTVILEGDGTLSGEHTIPSGVTLLIPFDDAYTLITDDMDDHINEADSAPTKTLYRQLIMESGAKITVNGAISIGSQAYKLMLGQVGPYGAIKMNNGSNITVASGGKLYAYGYIFYGDDTGGTVTVNSGGYVYETAFIMDYPGKITFTKETYDGGVFPMRAFTVRNVEVPMTLSYGAFETVAYSIWGSVIGLFPGYFKFIGNDSSYPFMLNSGATVTKSYKNGIQYLTTTGSCTLNPLSIKLKLGGILGGIGAEEVDVTSSSTSGFPLPSGFDITVSSGTLTMGDNVLMLEGSKITVADGAFLNTGGKSLYVLDSTDDPGPNPTAGVDVHSKAYTIVDTDAILDVNGTLTVSTGGLYTSANKASITSSGGTGKIVFSSAAYADKSLAFRSGIGYLGENAVWTTLDPVDPAYLQHQNGGYLETASGLGASTYTYINGFWHKGGVCVGGAATCTQKAVCATCKQEYGELAAHSFENGICSVCGQYMRVEIVATNIAVNDGLDMWFYVKAENVDNDSYKAVVTKQFADDRSPNPITVTIPSGQWEPYTDTSDGTQYLRFPFSDISAKEMTDNVDAIICHTDGTQVSNAYSQTVQNYAITTLEGYKTNNSAKAEALKYALMDMLEYGASAQMQFNYNTSLPANVHTKLADFNSYITTTTPACASQKNYGNNVAGVTVSATNTLMFTFYFKVANPDGMYAIIKYTPSGETTEQTVTVQSEDFYERVAGSLYGVDVTGLSIVDGRALMTCTLYNSDGTVVTSATDSIEGYAYRNAEKGEIFMDMMRFVDSAFAYFTT